MNIYYLDCQFVKNCFLVGNILAIVRKTQNVAELILRADFCLKHYRRFWMLFSTSCLRNSEQKWQTTLTKYTFFHLIILQLVRIDF